MNSMHPGSPPVPEPKGEQYTDSRVKAGQEYATNAIKYFKDQRETSGISRLAVNHYLEVCEQALCCTDDIERAKLNEELRYYENEMHERPSLSPVDPRFSVPDRQLQGLARLRILMRYGDYAADFWSEVKRSAATKDKDGKTLTPWPNTVAKRLVREVEAQLREEPIDWESCHKTLKKQVPIFEKFGTMKGLEPVKTSYTLWKVAESQGVPPKYLTSLIAMYAERNRLFYSPLQQYLQEGQHTKVAETLHHDYEWARQNYPTEWITERSMIMYWMEEMIRRWFNASPASNYTTWWPTDTLKRDIELARPKHNEERSDKGTKDAKQLITKIGQNSARKLADRVAGASEYNQYLFDRVFGGEERLTGVKKQHMPPHLREEMKKRYTGSIRSLDSLERLDAWVSIVMGGKRATDSMNRSIHSMNGSLSLANNVACEVEAFWDRWGRPGLEGSPDASLENEMAAMEISASETPGKGKGKEPVRPLSPDKGKNPKSPSSPGKAERSRSPVKVALRRAGSRLFGKRKDEE